MSALTECPKCNIPDIEATGDGVFDESYAHEAVACQACGFTWREVYKHSEQDLNN